VALDRATGREVWRAQLPGSDFVNLVVDRGELYASSRGEIFRLNPQSGAILWHNPMPGFGWGLMTIAGAANSQVAPLGESDRQQKQAASDVATAGT
jgi:outer membrane protein assembly factor BamB